ncbi:hypothetical protein CGZ65_09445 [Neisseria weixii]|nr:hypothetical protein CGZ65_09445 [Neisseria weixii]
MISDGFLFGIIYLCNMRPLQNPGFEYGSKLEQRITKKCAKDGDFAKVSIYMQRNLSQSPAAFSV